MHAPDEEVGPDRVQVSVCVCFGLRLYVNANDTEPSVRAPDAGEGATNVITGWFEVAEAIDATNPINSAAPKSITSSRSFILFSLRCLPTELDHTQEQWPRPTIKESGADCVCTFNSGAPDSFRVGAIAERS
jgi:hypothetical protein